MVQFEDAVRLEAELMVRWRVCENSGTLMKKCLPRMRSRLRTLNVPFIVLAINLRQVPMVVQNLFEALV